MVRARLCTHLVMKHHLIIQNTMVDPLEFLSGCRGTCNSSKTGCSVYSSAPQPHSGKQPSAQQGRRASEDVHDSTVGE